MRLSVQPSRPSAITCCFLSSLKTLPIPAQEHDSHAFVNVSVRYRLMAGFGVSANGRFWVSTEACDRYSRVMQSTALGGTSCRHGQGNNHAENSRSHPC